jgi:hypothetical protein
MGKRNRKNCPECECEDSSISMLDKGIFPHPLFVERQIISYDGGIIKLAAYVPARHCNNCGLILTGTDDTRRVCRNKERKKEIISDLISKIACVEETFKDRQKIKKALNRYVYRQNGVDIITGMSLVTARSHLEDQLASFRE